MGLGTSCVQVIGLTIAHNTLWVSALFTLGAAGCSQRDRQTSQQHAAVAGPNRASAIPTVFRDACQGEDCEGRFAGLACVATTLRKEPADTSPTIERAARGDTVQVTQTDLHVVSPGAVVMRRDFDLNWEDASEAGRFPRADTLHFKASDTLYLLRYLELGDWTWWRNGRLESGSQFWAAGDGFGTMSDDSSIAVARSQPNIQTWLRVVRRNGVAGWWQQDSVRSIRSFQSMMRWNDHCE
jgi:hypothetical protein